jgi:hypothetical protein
MSALPPAKPRTDAGSRRRAERQYLAVVAAEARRLARQLRSPGSAGEGSVARGDSTEAQR